jgi:hypothetical protein
MEGFMKIVSEGNITVCLTYPLNETFPPKYWVDPPWG